MKRFHSGHRSSGQVLVVGIFLIVALALLLLAGFDIHNAMRAKLKLEIAQEAAALAGAEWQRKSLNLLGDLNVLKACAVLLEGDENWQIPLPAEDPKEPDSAARRIAALQSRIDVLTEMQTRLGFIGPLIGFAAAQQAAKANGMPVIGTLENYLSLLDEDLRYKPDGGAPEVIHRYKWKAPYRALLSDISAAGIAVWPNARTAGSMVVYPEELKSEALYAAIYAHWKQIEAAKGRSLPAGGDEPLSWNDKTKNFVYQDLWRSRFASPPWWSIDVSSQKFPQESEIFCLGIQMEASSWSESSDYDKNWAESVKQSAAPLQSSVKKSVYADAAALPDGVNMKFCCYDNTWYPEYYRARHSDYDYNHFNYWFQAPQVEGALRRNVREEYRYEGPASYAEGSVVMGRSTIFRVGKSEKHTEREFRIGKDRSSVSDDERGGAMARCFGALESKKMPVELPLVLPVFDRVAAVPTYMPIPYGFSVLRGEFSALERFLSWLSGQTSLSAYTTPLPAGGEYYRKALELLTRGPEFRYYGWNPAHNEEAFDISWKGRLASWYEKSRSEPDACFYNTRQGTSNPGWFQEPRLFSLSQDRRSSETAEKTVDYLNGGIATKVYIDAKLYHKADSRNKADQNMYRMTKYYIVDSKGHIITNADQDPTIQILENSPSPKGSGWVSGTGDTPGYTRDNSKGPRRL